MASASHPAGDGLPLAGLTLSVVGPGRVGTSLACWAVAAGASPAAVAGRTGEPAAALAARLGGEPATLEEVDTSDADLLLVAVSDGALREVAGILARRPQARVVLHTSGSRGSSVLLPLGKHGSSVGSFHPLRAFPRVLPDLESAAGTFFALDGGPEAVALGRRLASAFGGTAEVVSEEDRELYHLAASTAAGGVATLVVSALALAREIGLPDAVRTGYLELARGALAAVGESLEGPAGAGTGEAAGGPERAITGPLARGDAGTFLRELDALRRRSGGGDTGEPGATRGEEAAPEASPARTPALGHLAVETVRLCAGDAAARRLSRTLEDRGFLDPPESRC